MHEGQDDVVCCLRSQCLRLSPTQLPTTKHPPSLKMVFPFTFTSLIPFPFSGVTSSPPQQLPTRVNLAATPCSDTEQSEAGSSTSSRRRLPPRPPRRIFPDDDDDFPIPSTSRKRGWQPSVGPQPIPTTSNRPVAGDFDTPSKYVGMTMADVRESNDLDQHDSGELHFIPCLPHASGAFNMRYHLIIFFMWLPPLPFTPTYTYTSPSSFTFSWIELVSCFAPYALYSRCHFSSSTELPLQMHPRRNDAVWARPSCLQP